MAKGAACLPRRSSFAFLSQSRRSNGCGAEGMVRGAWHRTLLTPCESGQGSTMNSMASDPEGDPAGAVGRVTAQSTLAHKLARAVTHSTQGVKALHQIRA